MRLGTLIFDGNTPYTPDIAPALGAAKQADVDVVTGEEAISSRSIAKREAARLSRADCDGIVFFVGAGVNPAFVMEAALHVAGIPLLLMGAFSPAFFDALGALSEIGVTADRHLHDEKDNSTLLRWLISNRKDARRPGLEAARKLYGQRFALFDPVPRMALDAAQWQSQLGVSVVTFSPGELATRGNPPLLDLIKDESIDFCALGAGVEVTPVSLPIPCATHGDVNGALTLNLLHLIGDGERAVGTVDLETPNFEHATGRGVTFARITRRSGRFRCFVAEGTLAENNQWFHMKQNPYPFLEAGRLHYISPGTYHSAVRAACEALDIEVVNL
jgi:L-fucose isomerase-like protein